MAIRRRPCGTPKPAWRASPPRCWKIIDKETVDFRPNYDDSEVEPEVLPTRVPNLLVNGSEGIAVGMASKIPPHNLTRDRRSLHRAGAESRHAAREDRRDACRAPISPPAASSWAARASTITSRAAAAPSRCAPKPRPKRWARTAKRIIVTEIPYQVNKARLIEHAAGLVNEKKLEGISEIRDESDRDGMRIVFELKRGEQAEVVLNNLYKQTQMQVNFGVILLAIVNGQPRELGLIDALKRFIDHRVDVVRRRTDYLLRKAREREQSCSASRRP